jgi:type I restriction enzyme S subunit
MNDGVAVLRLFHSFDLGDFGYLYLTHQTAAFRNVNQGMGQPNLNTPIIAGWFYPLPPLAEQKRIVAKVDELMALCDRLEAQQQERETRHAALARASLGRFADAPTPANLNFLFHPSYTIPPADLRKSILTLAVQGKLVPQDPNDEPASVLLERIRVKKNAALGRRDLAGLSAESENASNLPFAQPASWVWATFGDVHITAHTGIDRGKSQQSSTLLYAYFKMNNITSDGRCDIRQLTRIDATDEEVEKYRLQEGDFLFNTRNSAALVGKTCVFASSSDDTFLFNNNILRVHFGQGINTHFANLWFCSSAGRSLLDERKSSTTNVAAIYQGKLLTMPFPIPPFPEQRRIVAKVDQLQGLCDELAARQEARREARWALAEPFVVAVCQDEAASFLEGGAEGRFLGYRVAAGVDGAICNLGVFRPNGNQSPAQLDQLAFSALLRLPHGQGTLRWSDVVAGPVINLARQFGGKLIEQNIELRSQGVAAAHDANSTPTQNRHARERLSGARLAF